MLERVRTDYHFETQKLAKPLELAVVSDLHDTRYDDLWPLIEGADALLVPGDVSSRYTQTYSIGVDFLREAAKRLPTFFSIGNHEARQTNYQSLLRALEQTGAEILLNRYVRLGELWIGGWYDPEIIGKPDILDEFEGLDGYKVLLCHKPEDYIRRIRGRDVDLVVAGHAHGGQIRVRGRGLYSPGQGIFPKYTHGVVDGKLVISAGVSNPVRVPRWGNPCEVVSIRIAQTNGSK